MAQQRLSKAWLEQHAQVVRRVLRGIRNDVQQPTRRPRESYLEGFTDGAITAASRGTMADATVLVWQEDDDGNWAQAKYPDGTNVSIEVKYPWDSDLEDNTYVHIRKVGRHWMIVAAGCAAEA